MPNYRWDQGITGKARIGIESLPLDRDRLTLRERLAYRLLGVQPPSEYRPLEDPVEFSDEASAVKWVAENPDYRHFETRVQVVQPTVAGQPVDPNTTLWQRLGETAGISRVVESFYAKAFVDSRVRSYFDLLTPDGQHRLKFQMVAILDQVTGGPKNYTGAPLADAHQHLGINNDAFDAVGELLLGTLEEFGVSKSDRATVADVLEQHRSLVVTRE